ncbi:probable cysteine protease RD19D [Rutidosis leptorrhynchoides]|uniref:probable cysteine protease RD19D n=1 Tax=Rutidosis leptorrhynchoides TaxID=125765 RepID=UPI003A98E171
MVRIVKKVPTTRDSAAADATAASATAAAVDDHVANAYRTTFGFDNMKSLSYAVVITILTCAVHATRYDAIIRQVTEAVTNNNHLIGTPTEQRFTAFIQEHGKQYSSRDEYVHRLGVFYKNLIRAAEHQLLDPSATHGVTPFSDLTEEEFESMYLGVKGGNGGELNSNGFGTAPPLKVDDLPEDFDWREKGAVTEVKTQGVCGSCWAFSTTGVIEGANFIETGKLLNLSEQQLVDCDHTCDSSQKDACDNGCSGGLMTNAYNYLIKSGGIQSEESYPYTGKSGECKFDSDKIAAKVVNFTNIPADEDQMAAHLIKHGPLAVGLNAVFMQTYIGGVSCPLICSKKRVNHGVLIVGYGSEGFSILRLSKKPYWIIKNSWGKHWGEKGYYKLCRGSGMCGMDTMVSGVVTQNS